MRAASRLLAVFCQWNHASQDYAAGCLAFSDGQFFDTGCCTSRVEGRTTLGRRKPCLPFLQKSAVRSVARRTKRNVIEDRFFCFSGLFSQHVQLVLRRAASTLWIRKVFGKMFPPQLPKLLFRKRFLLVLPWLAPRIRQGQSLPQCHATINPQLAIPWPIVSFFVNTRQYYHYNKRDLDDFDWRLFSASDSAGSVKRCQRHKAAQASRLLLRGFFQQLALLQGVVRKYFGPHRSLGSAPGRNVVSVLGHRKTMVALQPGRN